MADKNQQDKKPASFYLTLNFLNSIQFKSMLYEKELKSIENFDLNIGDILKSSRHQDDDDDYNDFVTKTIAKSRESLKKESLLSTVEYRHWVNTMESVEEYMENFAEFIDDECKNLTTEDLNKCPY
ncbi:hypothetical protein DERF_009483 [Dermatophagoides farinae]|uniref:Uncharacterized protein n=1 Tax=Dermatophagoides farinae TaxID=6954 RepID=A0A922L2L2_DERFA|nr:hypothetical protein DERF_009483 [Dermatophagoides farinae]